MRIMNKTVLVLGLSLILFTGVGASDNFVLDSENDWNDGIGQNTKVNGSLLEMTTFEKYYAVDQLSYSGTSKSVSSEDEDPEGLAWTDSGDKLFMSGSGGDSVYEYSCTSSFDLSSCSYSGNSLDVSGQSTSPNGLEWSGSGDSFIIAAAIDDSVFQYSCSNAFDLSSCSYSTSVNVGGNVANGPDALEWSDSGDSLVIVDNFYPRFHDYSCSTPFDVTSCSHSSSSDLSGGEEPKDLDWSDSGESFVTVGASNNAVYKYSCSTAFDVSSCSYSGNSLDVSGESTGPTGVVWGGSGGQLFMSGQDYNTGGNLYVYDGGISEGVDSPASFTSEIFDVGSRGRWMELTADASLNGGSGKVVLQLSNDYAMRQVSRRKTVKLEDGENSVRFNLEGFRYAQYQIALTDTGSLPSPSLDRVSTAFERIDDDGDDSSGPVFGGGDGETGGFAQSVVDFFGGIGETLLGFFS